MAPSRCEGCCTAVKLDEESELPRLATLRDLSKAVLRRETRQFQVAGEIDEPSPPSPPCSLSPC